MTDETKTGSEDAPALPRVLPTQAEVRAADLEQEDRSSESNDARSREQKIRDAAYANYLRRGAAPGHELDDWLEAERSVDGAAQQRRPDESAR